MRYVASAALLLLFIFAVSACAGSEQQTDAATIDSTPRFTGIPSPPADQISHGPAPWTTSPPWDCKGTPPAGYISQFPDSDTCVVISAPSCPHLEINGRSFCGPEYGGYSSNCGPGTGPGTGYSCKISIFAGDSTVTWEIDANGVASIIEWKVQEADSAAFADLHKAFYEDVSEQPTITPGPTPPKSPGALPESDSHSQ